MGAVHGAFCRLLNWLASRHDWWPYVMPPRSHCVYSWWQLAEPLACCLLQSGGGRFCQKCQCYKPPRCHHCRVCHQCVLR